MVAEVAVAFALVDVVSRSLNVCMILYNLSPLMNAFGSLFVVVTLFVVVSVVVIVVVQS